MRKFPDSQSNQIFLLWWVLPGADKPLTIIYQDSGDWPPPPCCPQFQLSQLFLFCLLLELVRTLSPMAIETAAVKYSSSSWPWCNKRFLMAQIMLRILAIAFSLAAISLMITNTQTVLVFLVQMKATYSSSSAWRFFLGANIVTCILSVLSLIFVCLISRSASHMKYFLLFLHDMVTMVLLISGCAAGTAIGYVGKYGESKMGWGPVCGLAPKFCNRSTICLVLSYLAFLCYLGLTILSAHKLMSRATEWEIYQKRARKLR